MPNHDRIPTHLRAALAAGAVLLVGALVVVGLLLRSYGPGNMGNGFLAGAGLALLAAVVVGWRVARRPQRATTFERGWTHTGDERDDAVITRALAVLGLLALPLTGAAGILIALGVDPAPTLALTLFAQVAVLAVAFVGINRRA